MASTDGSPIPTALKHSSFRIHRAIIEVCKTSCKLSDRLGARPKEPTATCNTKPADLLLEEVSGSLPSRSYQWSNSLRVLMQPKPLRFNLDFRPLSGLFHPFNANKINGLFAHYRYFLLTKSGTSEFITVRISETHFLTVANLDPRRSIIASMGKSMLRATIKVRFPDTEFLSALCPKSSLIGHNIEISAFSIVYVFGASN